MYKCIAGFLFIQVNALRDNYMGKDEQVLVVPRKTLFSVMPEWNGICTERVIDCVTLITQAQEFHPRSVMEEDIRYKQIIPYLVFTHEDRYFLMQRKSDATEVRLRNKYSLGIGGHIRKEDMQGVTIFDWAKREFEEEVSYQGKYTFETLGLLNDDSSPVGQVHMGIVLLVRGDSSLIKVKSELKSGALYSLQECLGYYEQLEDWSKYLVDFLVHHTSTLVNAK